MAPQSRSTQNILLQNQTSVQDDSLRSDALNADSATVEAYAIAHKEYNIDSNQTLTEKT